jgi:hypothetical protein
MIIKKPGIGTGYPLTKETQMHNFFLVTFTMTVKV